MPQSDLREVYTAIALHALLSNPNITQGTLTALEAGITAVRVADATIATLKENPSG